MSWTVSLLYVMAVLVVVAAFRAGLDPVVGRRLGLPRSPPEPVPRRLRPVRVDVDRSVPDLLDLVALSVTAGQTPRLALERAGVAISGSLGEVLSRSAERVALGAPWRGELRAAADRSGVPELRRLAAVLERSERLGAPVAVQLRRLAADVREERRLAEEERARKAPVAMLFPLVLCVLPAFVISALVPAVLVAARGLG
jgi:tight adherence protein C